MKKMDSSNWFHFVENRSFHNSINGKKILNVILSWYFFDVRRWSSTMKYFLGFISMYFNAFWSFISVCTFWINVSCNVTFKCTKDCFLKMKWYCKYCNVKYETSRNFINWNLWLSCLYLRNSKNLRRIWRFWKFSFSKFIK